MTDRLLQILQHSLGLDKYGQGDMYRNSFVTGPETDDWADCKELCEMGLMYDNGKRSAFGGMHIFTVTDSGKTAVRFNSPAPPKLTRSQQRYRRFLKEDSGHSFGEWLKMEHVK